MDFKHKLLIRYNSETYLNMFIGEKDKSETKKLLLVGIEPTAFGLEVQRSIH